MVLDLADMGMRVGFAFASGFILGMEREAHGRPAGLRTIVLVCVASAIAAILSEQFYRGSFAGDFGSQTWHPDPARLAAGILTGIGFLGAGVIIHQQNFIRGVTTASQIWFVTILGLCFGGGQFSLGIIGLIVSIVTVFFLRKIEVMIARESYATLRVSANLDGGRVAEIIRVAESLDIKIKQIEMENNLEEKRTTMAFKLRFNKKEENQMPERLLAAVAGLPGITSVHWK